MSETADEPTMEDILASIRKIISDDTGKPTEANASAATAPAPAGQPAERPPANPPVAQMAAPQPAPSQPMLSPVAQPQATQANQTAPRSNNAVAQGAPRPAPAANAGRPTPQPRQPVAPANRPPQPPAADDVLVLDQVVRPGRPAGPVAARPSGNHSPAINEDRLLSAATETLGTAAFASLERAVRMGRAGETLEDLVRNLLRPMLRSWIDQNLPSLVERMVQSEIQKIVSGARRNWDDDF